eukprot:CAMPEP_0118634730 /NCGR_PEP_ID=MMETSP0785-20121206/1703_1 /TAXON_ID=91992 /ORGANISM="Bolidomonas pacifica, Strain CCMP 1866" /LENGTH=2059 /DNA_ID=CAMNT_0006525725 /DNA_START=76 /DNA_END=6252 /DNA_ORIENTATION=-
MKLLSALIFVGSWAGAQSKCKVEFDLRSIDYSSEQKRWDENKMTEVTETKNNRFDIAMFTVTLDSGEKVMYTGEDGPHVNIYSCIDRDGNTLQPEWEWENHRKLGEESSFRYLTEEELARPDVRRTAAQFKHARFLAAKKQKASQFALQQRRRMNGPPQCVTDAGCDVSVFEGDPSDMQGACTDIQTLIECVNDQSSCDDETKDSIVPMLESLENCYCNSICDMVIIIDDGSDSSDPSIIIDDGSGEIDEDKIPECLMSCAGGRPPATCAKAAEVKTCAEKVCSQDEFAAITPIFDQVEQCVCDEDLDVCNQLDILPVDPDALVDPYDYAPQHFGDLRHESRWIMPAYEDDALSKFFQFHAFQSEYNHETPAKDKFSPFADFNIVHRKTDDGDDECVPMVKFNPNDKDFVEVTEVDGVSISCLLKFAAGYYQKKVATDPFYQEAHMAQWWNGNEYLKVLMNLRTWMRRINGYAPPTTSDGDFPVSVKYIDPKTGNEKSRDSIYLTYEKWGKLDALFEARMSKLWSSNSKCAELPIATDSDGNDLSYDDSHGDVYHHNMKFRFVMPDSCPAPQDKIEKNSKESFKDTIMTNALKFGRVIKVTDLGSGKSNKDGWVENMPTMQRCSIGLDNIADGNGTPLREICDLEDVTPMKPDCIFPDMKHQTWEMEKALWSIKNAKISPSVENLLPILGSDAWGACSSLIDQALSFTEEPRKITTSQCTYEWDTPAWKADPCCNWELSQSMCCVPKEVDAFVPTPYVDTDALAAYCADDVKQLTLAVYSAKAFTEAKKESTDVSNGCSADKTTKMEEYEPYRNIGKNCSDIVMGSWESNWESSQECTTNFDCYTGTCKAAAQGSKVRYCQTSTDATFLAVCLIDKLKYKPKALAKTREFFAEGNARASPTQMAQGITQTAGRSMCMGPDGWHYNPDWKECKTFDQSTYECTEYYCDGEDDCAEKCEDSGQSCNTNPWEGWDSDKCLDDKLNNGGKFCGRCWGGVTTDANGVLKGTDCHEESHASECRAHMDGNSFHNGEKWTIETCQKFHGTTDNPNTNARVRESDYDWDTNNWCELDANTLEECNPADDCEDAGFTERWACVVEDVPPQGCYSLNDNLDCNKSWCEHDDNNCCQWWENQFHEHHYNSKWDTGGHQWERVCQIFGWKGGEYNDEDHLKTVCPAGSTPMMIASKQQSCSDESFRCYAPLEVVADEAACQTMQENESIRSALNTEFGEHFWHIHFHSEAQRCVFETHNYWGDVTKVQQFIDYCEDDTNHLSGFKMHRGKNFHLGRFDTEEKCNAGTCSFGSHLDAEECAETAECSDWNCRGCRDNWQKADEKRNNGIDVPWSVCYKLPTEEWGQDECNEIEGAEYVTIQGATEPVCIISKHEDQANCVGEDYIWGNCHEMDIDQCGGDGNPFPADGVAEHLLVCEASAHAKCRDKASCEAAGWCDGGLRASYYYRADGDEYETEHYKPFVCVLPAKIEHGWSHCNDYLPDGEYDTWQHGIEHLWASDECILLRIDDENECEMAKWGKDSDVSGVWTSTIMTQATCENKQKCKRGDWDFSQLPEEECTKCGMTMGYVNNWHGNTWTTGTVENNLVWLDRSYDKKNTWGSEIDQWRFQEVVRSIIDSLNEEIHADYVNCMYAGQMDSIKKISCVCGTEVDGKECGKIFSGMVNVVDTTAYADAAETAGRAMATKVKMQSDSVVVDEDEGVYSSNITASKKPFVPKASENVGTDSVSKQVRRMLTRAFRGGVRRLEAADNTLNSAECMTVVENDAGFLVGQLLGDCVVFNSTAEINPNAPATLCLATNDAISVNEDFSVKGFATLIGDDTYIAMPEVAIEEQGTLCLDVTESVTICPIARVADYAAAEEDMGDGECGLVEYIVTEVVMKQKCTAGDSESCAWLQKGSLSYYAAIGTGVVAAIAVVGCIVASCCGLWAHPTSRKVMKKHLNKAFFSSADADGDGMLDKGEVVAMFKKEFGEDVTPQEVDSLFAKYDVDKNGELDFEEYKKMMKEHKVNVDNGTRTALPGTVNEKGIQLLTIESKLKTSVITQEVKEKMWGEEGG